MPLATTPFILLLLLLLLLIIIIIIIIIVILIFLLLPSLSGMTEDNFRSQSTSVLRAKTVSLVIISKTVGKKRFLDELRQDFQ